MKRMPSLGDHESSVSASGGIRPAGASRRRIGVAVLARTVFLESVGRYEAIFRDRPPGKFAQFVERVPMVRGRLDGREVWLEETAKAEFDAVGDLLRLKGLTLDVTARKRSADQQSLLIAALDHHVKNLLARVALVAKDMRPGSGSLDEYIQALDRRIQSMADAHALLSQNRWGGVDLAELVRRQLAPAATDANATIGGPNVTPGLHSQILQHVAVLEALLLDSTGRCGSSRLPSFMIKGATRTRSLHVLSGSVGPFARPENHDRMHV